MIIDKENEFSDGQAVTATAISTNVIDLGLADPGDIGAGDPVVVEFAVDVLPVSGAATTLVITLETSAAAALTTPTVLYTHPSLLKAALAAGTKLRFAIPGGKTWLRYFGVRYTVGVGDYTAGSFSCYVANSDQNAAAYFGIT